MSTYHKKPRIAALTSLLVIILGSLFLGKVSGYEAKVLIANSVNGLNTLCNTIVLASATILALLLTSLGITNQNTTLLKKDHYKLILDIARLDTVVFVAAMIFFLLFNLPITKSENISHDHFIIFYYGAILISSLLSSALIYIVILLYQSIVSMIKIIGLGITDHPFAKDDEEIVDKELNK